MVLTDDASTDGTYEAVKKKIQEFPRLRTRTILIKNYQNIASLGNKVLMVHKHCKEGSIVFDMDADDSLIGRQVMKLINACYQSSDAWFIYSNYLHFNRNYASGLSREIPKAVFAANSYRTSSQWVTGHLRTYYRDLFVKIPLEYFTESGRFQLDCSDHYILFAVAELAGSKHTRFIPDLLYWYKPSYTSPCKWNKIWYYEFLARSLTPLLPLNSLREKPKITWKYTVPANITSKLNNFKNQYEVCIANGKI